MTEIDMDEAEMLHLAMADYMLSSRDTPPIWREQGYRDISDLSPDALRSLIRKHSERAWRRFNLAGDWNKVLPLYLWITVKKP